jgi:magnesium and cobalt transporter
MEKGQMGSSSDGLPATADATQDDGSEPPQRGLIGRIINALTPAAASDVMDVSPAPAPAATTDAPHILNLRRLRVDDVATPNAEIVAVPLTIGLDDLVAVFRDSGYSRLPVYKGTMDHPQGLVLFKDLALEQGFGSTTRFSLRKLLRPIMFAAPSMPVGVLLQKMQKERIHMALVIDEYGGVDGVVTIEDLIETVIGEIEDEHDEDEGVLWKEEKPGVFLAQSMTPLAAFEAAIGMDLHDEDEDDDIDTLGGLVFLRTGRVPAVGEVMNHESGVSFEIVEADPRRIKRLRVRLPQADAPAP